MKVKTMQLLMRLLTYGRVTGWVFGAWSEASEPVHSMVQRVAEARLEVADLQPGVRGAPKPRAAQLAGLVGHVRRKLSISAVQQTSRLLLDRLQLLGEGAAEAAARRDKAVMLEAVAARERRAQDACARQGRGIVRRGEHVIRGWYRTEALVALNPAEADAFSG